MEWYEIVILLSVAAIVVKVIIHENRIDKLSKIEKISVSYPMEWKKEFDKYVNEKYVECEECKCLVKKDSAHKGKGVIKEVDYTSTESRRLYMMIKEHSISENLEYIYYPYYCKIHVPKVKK